MELNMELNIPLENETGVHLPRLSEQKGNTSESVIQ